MPDNGTALDAAKLQEELAQARRLLAEKDNQLRDTGRKLSSEQAVRLQAQEGQIDNAIAASEGRIAALKADLIKANESADYAAAAELQEKLYSAVSDRDAAKRQKEAIAAARVAPPQQNDPLAVYGAPGSPVRNWVERNPRFLSDEAYKQQVLRGHHLALLRGHAEGSPDYMRFVEDAAQNRGEFAPAEEPRQTENTSHTRQEEPMNGAPLPDVITDAVRPVQPQARAAGEGSTQSVYAAPSRSQPGTRQSQGGRVSLSAEEVETAQTLAASIRPDLKNKADVIAWYHDMKNSPNADRVRRKWEAA